jgi:hypothetical protein
MGMAIAEREPLSGTRAARGTSRLSKQAPLLVHSWRVHAGNGGWGCRLAISASWNRVGSGPVPSCFRHWPIDWRSLREGKTLLLAAGYAPRYLPTSLGDPARTLLASPTGVEPAVTRILPQNGFGSKGDR